jgi:hypothetical protein
VICEFARSLISLCNPRGTISSGTTNSKGIFRTQRFAFDNGTHYAKDGILMKTGCNWLPLDLDVENDDNYPDDFFIR